MTFDEWWKDHGIEFATPYEKNAAKKTWQAATLVEREECAKVCDNEASIEGIAQKCADAIRARNEGGR